MNNQQFQTLLTLLPETLDVRLEDTTDFELEADEYFLHISVEIKAPFWTDEITEENKVIKVKGYAYCADFPLDFTESQGKHFKNLVKSRVAVVV